MDISPWIPCGLSMASVFLCLMLLAIGPDPRKSPDSSFSANPPQSIQEENISLLDQDPKTSPKSELVNGVFAALSDRNTMLLVPVFLVNIFRYAMLSLLIQYASVRFGLKISTGATFYTETALINIILFLFLVPRSTAYIRLAYNVRPETIDLVLVRTSVALLALGCVFIFAAGFGSRVSALSLVSYWISNDAKATLYAAIVVLESLGHAVGDPAIQLIFAGCLGLPPFWRAMPFFVAAGFYALATLSSSFVKLDQGMEHQEEPLLGND
ncbi:uncharacterized protein K444DRAFT_523851 [Hyaloscypha bicolor E]|uniref:MFS general substrate transporter n=1 Tax=Hyaloscypha bicolor E TaxID=1095630 RepID=A0A2J6THK8_9HELO|nr:uncharacterized protein K444DRAFT_523851 [Hyaloscypha bicolor E]PMD62481.1 hypothetical protein K444DRAFT_523851 [Hyaloscypha bicolor E]